MTDTHLNTVDMMTLPDTALMSPGHVCSLYHCIDRVWRVWRCWRGRNPGQTASTRTAPLLSHRSSPAATCDHQPAPGRETHHHLPTFLPQAGPGLYLHCHLKWLCPLCCVSGSISSPAVFQDTHDTHVLDTNCV